MPDQVENQLIAELSRRVVTDVAPAEKRAFNAISKAYFKNPEKTLKGEGGDDELMGFGLAEISLLLTPIILEVVKEVLKDLLKDSVKDSIKKSSLTVLEKIQTFFKGLFGANPSQPAQLQYVQLLLPFSEENPLSQEKLRQVHQRARESAIRLGVDANQATLIADSVITSLQLPL